jgi:hypothetical protein
MDMKVKSWTDAQPGPCRRAARIGAARMQELTTVRHIPAPRDRCSCRLPGLRSHLRARAAVVFWDWPSTAWI